MEAPEPSPGRPATQFPAWDLALIVGGVLLLILAFFLVSHLLRPRISVLDRATGGRLTSGPYAGSRVCAECHPGEFAHFTRSGHAQTLRKAVESTLARRLAGRSVADPEQPGVTWTYVAD